MVKIPNLYTTPLFIGMTLGVLIGFSTFFSIRMEVKASYRESVDPSYPYVQAIAMHTVSGKPFLHYLSRAIEEGSDVVDGVNITEELMKFGETFTLKNATSSIITQIGDKKGENIFLAVPPGGLLTVISNY